MSKNTKAFILVFCLFVLCLAFIMTEPSEKGQKAEVSIDGQAVMFVDLHDEDKIISLESFGRNISLQLQNGKIRFLSSDCPNKTCVNTGFIDKPGQTAVCLPNKTAVTVLGK